MLHAKPVWLKGLEKELNIFAGFRASVPSGNGRKAEINLAASSLYRICINGEFVCHGPARAAHDYYRIDRIDITDFLTAEENVVAIEVAGYNVNSFYTLDQPSFLCAEIILDDKTIAATGEEGFFAYRLHYRRQKVQRYSFQRAFAESYVLTRGFDDWKKEVVFDGQTDQICICENKRFLPRSVPLPVFPILDASKIICEGEIAFNGEINVLKDRSLTDINHELLGFKENELDVWLTTEVQRLSSIQKRKYEYSLPADNGIKVHKDTFKILMFEKNATGFIKANIECNELTTLYFVFDEVLKNDDVDLTRWVECCNVVRLDLERGRYEFESFEPYTFKYLKVMVTQGSCELKTVSIREFKGQIGEEVGFQSSGIKLNKVFATAIETYQQNVIDTFMDCPSRERAGWLCDSFWMARISNWLLGNPGVESKFIEDYVLSRTCSKIPEKVLPCCYPADHYDGLFIPNWPLWLVLQIAEYIERGGSQGLIDRFKEKLYGYIEFLSDYENEDGLLEDLPGWVFIEWSKANEFVEGVNYPSNMLYCAALSSLAEIYNDEQLLSRSEKIRKKILEQSFNGDFFVDNAIRRKGHLRRTNNCTEVCQYYAFYFNIATPQTHGELRDFVVDELGPSVKHDLLYPANMLMGCFLRLELLSRWGFVEKEIGEIVQYFLPMAEVTGTFWEHELPTNSCSHGFASHLAYALYRDVLGLKSIDLQRRKIEVCLNSIHLRHCKGAVPVNGEYVRIYWYKEGGEIFLETALPSGYSLTVENHTGLKLRQNNDHAVLPTKNKYQASKI